MSGAADQIRLLSIYKDSTSLGFLELYILYMNRNEVNGFEKFFTWQEANNVGFILQDERSWHNCLGTLKLD